MTETNRRDQHEGPGPVYSPTATAPGATGPVDTGDPTGSVGDAGTGDTRGGRGAERAGGGTGRADVRLVPPATPAAPADRPAGTTDDRPVPGTADGTTTDTPDTLSADTPDAPTTDKTGDVLVAGDDRADGLPARTTGDTTDSTGSTGDTAAREIPAPGVVRNGQSAPGPVPDSIPDVDTGIDLDRRWHEVKAAFVDDPRQSVQQADALVEEALNAFTTRRRALQDQWKNDDKYDTEALRLALREYHALLIQLTGK